MADFDFTVDTTEMAESIRGVSDHVNGVTAAVVTMQAAVIAAEEDAATRICENVDRGFYSLIRSQISQKIAALRSKVDSRVMEMRQQSVSLAAVRVRMERDFAMIAARYAKLFAALDSSLRSRIFELDRPAVTLREREYTLINSRASRMQATVPVNQLESVQAHQSVGMARVRANANRAIQAMHRFVLDASHQRRTVSRMLNSAPRSGDRQTVNIPVLIFETEALRTDQTQWSYRFPAPPSGAVAAHLEREIAAGVFGRIVVEPWATVDDAVRNRIQSVLARKIDTAVLPERVRNHMRRLATSAAWISPTGSRV